MNLLQERDKLENELQNLESKISEQDFQAKVLRAKIKKLSKIIEQSEAILNGR